MNKGNEPRGKRQGAKGKRQGAKGKGQRAKGKGQRAKGKEAKCKGNLERGVRLGGKTIYFWPVIVIPCLIHFLKQ
jgi:hypothetical protein